LVDKTSGYAHGWTKKLDKALSAVARHKYHAKEQYRKAKLCAVRVGILQWT